MNRALAERHLAKAEAAVSKGRQLIGKQLARIAELERDGHDSAQALELLRLFRDIQTQHEVHRNRLRAELNNSLNERWFGQQGGEALNAPEKNPA